MPKKKNQPYGSPTSRITPKLIGDLRSFSELSWTGDGRLLWLERSSQHTRLMSWDSSSEEINDLSAEINIGGGIMYGGGSYTCCRDQIIFIEKSTQQLYWIPEKGAAPIPLNSSPHPKSSPRISPFGNNLVYVESENGIKDSIKVLNLSGTKAPSTLDNKFDFYNYLRWDPNGKMLAWVSWNHPYMPWVESQLILEPLVYPSSETPAKVGWNAQPFFFDKNASILQPEFSPDGNYLAFISDRSGWWQIYLICQEDHNLYQLTHAHADHGLPPWLQNQISYGFSFDGQRIYYIRNQLGAASLWQMDLTSEIETEVPLPEQYTWLEWMAVSSQDHQIAAVASGGRTPPELIVRCPWGECKVIRRSAKVKLEPELFSQPKPISWQADPESTIHGLYYEPQNRILESNGKPPLLIIIHSGPTRQKYAEFQPRTQYFTSRGYAVLEVNYRGSTGYGREYWQVLMGQWGVLDVEDVYSAASNLAAEGKIDPKRIGLLGSSSGGLTVLQLLIKYPGYFKAGISLYGVTNLLNLLDNPPKFEKYYTNWLVGEPDDLRLYKSRSPLFKAQKIRDPIAIFQGGKDPIVPQDQAEQIVKTLRKKGIPHEYFLYPEEGHGFKEAANVADFYQKAEMFLRDYLIEKDIEKRRVDERRGFWSWFSRKRHRQGPGK